MARAWLASLAAKCYAALLLDPILHLSPIASVRVKAVDSNPFAIFGQPNG
jgi:hypothetical protein